MTHDSWLMMTTVMTALSPFCHSAANFGTGKDLKGHGYGCHGEALKQQLVQSLTQCHQLCEARRYGAGIVLEGFLQQVVLWGPHCMKHLVKNHCSIFGDGQFFLGDRWDSPKRSDIWNDPPDPPIFPIPCSKQLWLFLRWISWKNWKSEVLEKTTD